LEVIAESKQLGIDALLILYSREQNVLFSKRMGVPKLEMVGDIPYGSPWRALGMIVACGSSGAFRPLFLCPCNLERVFVGRFLYHEATNFLSLRSWAWVWESFAWDATQPVPSPVGAISLTL
jgi:hypothetical protein